MSMEETVKLNKDVKSESLMTYSHYKSLPGVKE